VARRGGAGRDAPAGTAITLRTCEGRAANCLRRCAEQEEMIMAAHAGETAQKTGDFHCAKCDKKVHVTAGDKIPKCPNGHTEFETRTGEPGNKS
jgi:hypothetical protein